MRRTVERVRVESHGAPPKLPASLSALPTERRRKLDGLVALGALMSLVAEADEDFDAGEEKAIRRILGKQGGLEESELALVMAASREARQSEIGLYPFTKEYARKPYADRIQLLEQLFRVAFADKKLHLMELETIRKVSRLCWVTPKDFIEVKLRISKE